MIDNDQRLAKETINGIAPPESCLRSPTKILLWRALGAGQQMSKHTAAAVFGWHISTAGRAIDELHDAGVVHVVGWTRNGQRGPKTKVVAFGPGLDAPRPEALENAYVCRRWRANNHAQAIAIDWRYRLRRQARQGKLPRGNDPLLFAIMGVGA